MTAAAALDHLVCRECGRVEDVDCVFEPAIELAGFHVERAEVTFWGVCPACARAASTSPAAAASLS